MVDEELILRWMAFRDEFAKYRPPLKRFLNEYMDSNKDRGPAWLETRVEHFTRTITVVHEILGEQAFRLIDESLAICLELPTDFDMWLNQLWEAPVAAYTAVLAKKSGYPDMPSVVARVLACRRPDNRSESEVFRLKSVVRMAKILAVVDRGTARWLLTPIRERPELLGSGGYSSIDRNEWILAWSLVDPEYAKELFEKEIQRQLNSDSGVLTFGALPRTLEVLTASPQELHAPLTRRDWLWFGQRVSQ